MTRKTISRILRASAGSLFLAFPSFTSAQTWQEITANAGTPLNDQRFGIATDGTRLYALGGPDGKGVLVSSDGGQTFSQINTVSGAGYSLNDGNLLYALRFTNGRMWVTGNSGNADFHYLHTLTPGSAAWERSANGFPPPIQLQSFGTISDVVHDPATSLYYCIAEIGGVWTSADGLNWQSRTTGFGGIGAPASLAAIDGSVFALRPSSGISRTTDGGLTWTRNAPSFIDGGNLRRTGDAVSVVVPGLSATSIAHITLDKGNTWHTVPGLPLNMGSHLSGDDELLFTPTQAVTHITNSRLLYSGSAGFSWKDLPTDGLQLTGPVWPNTDSTGLFRPSRIERIGNHLFLLGSEVLDQNFNSTPKLYRLDVSSFDFIGDETEIVLQPTGKALLVGQSHVLQSHSTGKGLTYQWRKNGVDLPGATSPFLSLENAGLADAGDYTVVVTGSSHPPVTSAVATVTVVVREEGKIDLIFDQTNINAGGQVHLLDNSEAIVVRPTANPLTIYRIGADGLRLQNFTSNTTTSGLSDAKSLIDQNGNIIVSIKPNSNTTQLRRYHPDTFAFQTSVGIGTNSTSLRIHDLVEVPGKGYAIIGNFDRTNHMGTVVNIDRFALIRYDFTTDENYPGGAGPNSSSLTKVTCAPDGSIYVAGGFSDWSGVSTPRGIARIDPTGTLHAVPTNVPGTTFADYVHSLDDGRILTLFGNSGARILHALEPGGNRDVTFNTANHTITGISSVAQQPDGKIYLAGNFSEFGGVPAAGYIRLHPDGTVDESFYTATGFSSGAITDVTYDPRGYIYLSGTGGGGTTFQGSGPVGRGPVRIFAAAGDSSPPGSSGFASWSALQTLPADQRGPNATPASDGVANLVKYAVGGLPLENVFSRLPVMGSTGEDDDTYPTISYIRDRNAGGVTIGVEISTRLEFDDDLGSTLVSVQDLGNGTDRMTVRSNAPFASQPRQFFRLRVTEE